MHAHIVIGLGDVNSGSLLLDALALPSISGCSSSLRLRLAIMAVSLAVNNPAKSATAAAMVGRCSQFFSKVMGVPAVCDAALGASLPFFVPFPDLPSVR